MIIACQGKQSLLHFARFVFCGWHYRIYHCTFIYEYINKKPPKCLRGSLLEGLLSSQRQQNIEIRGIVNPDSVRIQYIRTRCILQYMYNIRNCNM